MLSATTLRCPNAGQALSFVPAKEEVPGGLIRQLNDNLIITYSLVQGAIGHLGVCRAWQTQRAEGQGALRQSCMNTHQRKNESHVGWYVSDTDPV